MSKEFTFYIDGSCIPNPGKGGYGIYGINPEGLRFFKYGYIEMSTNNISEATALLETLNMINSFSEEDRKHTMSIHADSNYVIGYFESILADLKKSEPNVKGVYFNSNVELWELIYKVMEKTVLVNKVTLKMSWVKGHSGVVGNEAADMYATKGRMLGNNKEYVGESVIVHENKPNLKADDIHPFISGKRWFFFSNTPGTLSDGSHIYFSVSYIDKKDMYDKNAGKKSAQSHYAICITKKPINVIDDIRCLFNSTVDTSPTLINVTVLSAKKVWAHIASNGINFLKYVKGTLSTLDEVQLGRVINPPKLIFNLETNFLYGLIALEKYNTSNPEIQKFDITDNIFSKEKGKNIVNKEFTNNTVIMSCILNGVNGADIELKINVGIDMPIRNKILAITKIKDAVITAEVILFEITKVSYRFVTILKCNDDVGVFYNPDSNFRIISK